MKKRTAFRITVSPGTIRALAPFLGVASGLLIGSCMIALLKVNPLEAYYYLLQGSVLNGSAFSEMLIKTVPLAMTGLAVSFSYKTGFFNIGAEGQIYLGAVGATIIGIQFPLLPAYLHIPLCFILGSVLGGLYALVPGLLRAYRGVSEIVTTMLLNYVAAFFLSVMVQGPLKEPGTFYPRSVPIVESAALPRLFGTLVHSGIFLVLMLALFLYWFFKSTTYGLRMEIVGKNPVAGHFSGINVKSLIIQVLVISGCIAGAAGVIEILGVHGRLIENFSVGIGYEGIAVALLAGLHPLGVLFSALFFGILKSGANSMQIATGIPISFTYMIKALIILFAIIFSILPAIIEKRRKVRALRREALS